MKKITNLLYAAIIALAGAITPAGALEMPVYMGDIDMAYDSFNDTLILDYSDTGGDITLQFGNTLNKYLIWDNTASNFTFNDDVNLDGNQLIDFRVENNASAPAVCASGIRGRVYHNTTDNGTYVCDGTSWVQIDLTGDITAIGSMTSGDAFADTTADDDWLGLGSGAGRIEFDDQTTDEVNIVNANMGIGTSTPSANLEVYTADGITRIGNAFPNKTTSTDNGIGMYNITSGFKSGLFTEVDGELLSYGINISQIGDRDTTKTGGIFRMDTRATSPYFSVKRQAIGGSTEYSDIQISQSGDVGMGGYASDTNSFPGNLAILSRGATVPNLVLTGSAAQTANLLELRNNAGTLLSGINSTGALTIGQSGTAITRHLSATAAFDFAAMDGTCATAVTITVTGAVIGDTVIATPTNLAGTGIEDVTDSNWTAYVSAANTVTLRVCDMLAAGGGIDPASQTWRVDVWQH